MRKKFVYCVVLSTQILACTLSNLKSVTAQAGENDLAKIAGPADSSSSSSLKGDIDISFVPELGLVTIKGNKDDVQKVEDVIRQIKSQESEKDNDVRKKRDRRKHDKVKQPESAEMQRRMPPMHLPPPMHSPPPMQWHTPWSPPMLGQNMQGRAPSPSPNNPESLELLTNINRSLRSIESMMREERERSRSEQGGRRAPNLPQNAGPGNFGPGPSFGGPGFGGPGFRGPGFRGPGSGGPGPGSGSPRGNENRDVPRDQGPRGPSPSSAAR